MKRIATALVIALFATTAQAVLPGTSSRTTVTAAGGTIVYFTFKATSASHIEVLVGGVKQATGYAVTLYASQDTTPGGYVTFTSPPAVGTVIVVQRTMPLTQDLVLSATQPFPAKSVEKALDSLAMQIQQVARDGGGSSPGGGGGGGPVYWSDILDAPTFNWASLPGKPTYYPPASHSHPLNQISGIAGVADSSTYLRGDGVWAAPPGGGGGGGAPVDANYITILPNSTLSAERVLTPGNGMVLNYDTSLVTVGLNSGIQFLVGASSGALSGAYKVVPTCPPGKALTYDGATLSCIVPPLTPPTATVLGGVKGGKCAFGYYSDGWNADGSISCVAIGAGLTAIVTSDGQPPADPNQTYWIDTSASGSPTVGTPIFAPAAGSYTGAQNVALSTNTSGATICYTTNGVSPAAATAGTCSVGAAYSTPIAMSASGTVKAIGTKVGYVNSPIATAAYTIAALDSTPPVVTTFIPASVSTSLYIGLASIDFTATDDTGVTEWAVTRGACSSATGWSTSKPGSYKVVGSGNYTLRGCAKDAAGNVSTGLTATSTVSAAPDAPVMNTITTPVASPVAVSGTAAVGAEYGYTVRIYRSDAPGTPVKIVAGAAGNTTWSTSISTGDGLGAGTYTLYATVVQAAVGLESAQSASQTITVTTATQAASPTITPNGGTISGATSVTLACTSPSPTIRYTIDGSTPTGASTTYTGALSVSTPTTVKAICQSFGLTDSPVASASFVYANAAAPTFSPVAGTYTGTQTVTASTITSGADICYTTDGSDPAAATPGTCSHGTQVASGSTISVSVSGTLKALATKAGMANSGITTAAYTIVANTPTITPNGGSISGATSVTLACASPSPTIRYTTDGSTPNGSSTVYSSALSVSTTTTVKAICQSSGMTDSAAASATFTLAAATNVSDDFNRANGALGSNWTALTSHTAPTITSNAVSAASGATMLGAIWNGPESFGANQYCEVKRTEIGSIATDPATGGEQIGGSGCVVRTSVGANTYYSIGAWASDENAGCQINKVVSGAVIANAPCTVSWPWPAVLRLEVTGTGTSTVVTAKGAASHAGPFTTIATLNDTMTTGHPALDSGKPGIIVNYAGGGTSLDDFYAGSN